MRLIIRKIFSGETCKLVYCRPIDVACMEFISSVGYNSMVFSIHSSRKFTRVNFPLFLLYNKNEFKQIMSKRWFFQYTQKLYMYLDYLSQNTSRNKKIFRCKWCKKSDLTLKYSKMSKIYKYVLFSTENLI